MSSFRQALHQTCSADFCMIAEALFLPHLVSDCPLRKVHVLGLASGTAGFPRPCPVVSAQTFNDSSRLAQKDARSMYSSAMARVIPVAETWSHPEAQGHALRLCRPAGRNPIPGPWGWVQECTGSLSPWKIPLLDRSMVLRAPSYHYPLKLKWFVRSVARSSPASGRSMRRPDFRSSSTCGQNLRCKDG